VAGGHAVAAQRKRSGSTVARSGTATHQLWKRRISTTKGCRPVTQQAYLWAVQKPPRNYNKRPGLVTEEELRTYFLHLTRVELRTGHAQDRPLGHQVLFCRDVATAVAGVGTGPPGPGEEFAGGLEPGRGASHFASLNMGTAPSC
jgi:hypothetical protein